MTTASNNDFPSILVTEQGSAPASPAASHQRLYIRTSDHTLVTVNSSGTVAPVGAGGGSLSYDSATLGSPVAVNTSTFTDILSLASLAAGTWFMVATLVAHQNGAGIAGVAAKLWDGTTVYASGECELTTNDYRQTLVISTIVVLGSTTTVKVSAITVANNAEISASTTTGTIAKVTNLSAVKIA